MSCYEYQSGYGRLNHHFYLIIYIWAPSITSCDNYTSVVNISVGELGKVLTCAQQRVIPAGLTSASLRIRDLCCKEYFNSSLGATFEISTHALC